MISSQCLSYTCFKPCWKYNWHFIIKFRTVTGGLRYILLLKWNFWQICKTFTFVSKNHVFFFLFVFFCFLFFLWGGRGWSLTVTFINHWVSKFCMVIKWMSHDHCVKLWHCLLDNREIIGTASTNPCSFNPGLPYIHINNICAYILSAFVRSSQIANLTFHTTWIFIKSTIITRPSHFSLDKIRTEL